MPRARSTRDGLQFSFRRHIRLESTFPLYTLVRDQPVVTAEGLVGRVILVTPISSKVLLITDERFGAGAVTAQTAQSRLVGILRGRDQFLCELRLVAAAGKLENGEQVITSGQDQLYPKGLLSGHCLRPLRQSLCVRPTLHRARSRL